MLPFDRREQLHLPSGGGRRSTVLCNSAVPPHIPPLNRLHPFGVKHLSHTKSGLGRDAREGLPVYEWLGYGSRPARNPEVVLLEALARLVLESHRDSQGL